MPDDVLSPWLHLTNAGVDGYWWTDRGTGREWLCTEGMERAFPMFRWGRVDRLRLRVNAAKQDGWSRVVVHCRGCEIFVTVDDDPTEREHDVNDEPVGLALKAHGFDHYPDGDWSYAVWVMFDYLTFEETL